MAAMALQLSRDLDVQAKTAFVLAHKLREAIAAETKGAKLFGDVEIDGAYFGGHVRPANVKENRRDRRLAENQTASAASLSASASARAARWRSCQSTKPKASKSQSRLLTGSPPFMPTKLRTGMRCMPDGTQSGSITARLTASTALARTKWKAISLGFAAWCRANTTTFHRDTCTSMQTMPHGLKITDANQTARMLTSPLGLRWVTA
jgi:hypothetical protein